MSRVFEVDQGTPLWHLLRLGRVTASRAYKLLGAAGPVSQQQALLELTGCIDEWVGPVPPTAGSGWGIPGPPPRWGSPATDYGTEMEAEAVAAIETALGLDLVGRGTLVAIPPERPWLLASPDAVGRFPPGGVPPYLVEVKCPYSRVVPQTAPLNYWLQVQIQLYALGMTGKGYLAYYLPGKRVTYFTIAPDTEWVERVLLPRLDAIYAAKTVLPLSGEEAQQLREEMHDRVRLTCGGGVPATVRLDDPRELAELRGHPVEEDDEDDDRDAVEEEAEHPI